nr:unnamed protein product [Spirometra erinaceieuropaei]
MDQARSRAKSQNDLKRVQQLRKALAEKRKKLEKQEAKLSRRASATSLAAEPQQQRQAQTDASSGPSSLLLPQPSCKSPPSPFRADEEEVPLSLFQSQFFPSLFTQPSQTDCPQTCTVFCVPRAAYLPEDERPVDFVTARSSLQEPPSFGTYLTCRGNAVVFALGTSSRDTAPLWCKPASEDTKPLAVCMLMLPSATASCSTRVGLFLVCFHIHQKVLTNCLYVAEVTEEGNWSLVDALFFPISVKARASVPDISSLTGCADAVFVTGFGFIIAVVVPAFGLAATFRASLDAETFVLMGNGFLTAQFPPHSTLARLCFVNDSYDCLALLWDPMLESVASLVLSFDSTTRSHSRMSFYPLCVEGDGKVPRTVPADHLCRLFSPHAILVSEGPCPSYMLTAVLQGLPVSDGMHYDYLLTAFLPLEGPKITPLPRLTRLLPSEDMSTWNIFGDSLHQVLARLKFAPVDSTNVEHHLTLWSVADWLKSPQSKPITESKLRSQAFSPGCMGVVVFDWTAPYPAAEKENRDPLPSTKSTLTHVQFIYF